MPSREPGPLSAAAEKAVTMTFTVVIGAIMWAAAIAIALAICSAPAWSLLFYLL